jgi:ATP-dependent Clp protease ATP-binding subunit ClpA
LNSGRAVSFRNAILIMTTNVGAKEMVDFLDQRNIGFRSTRSDMEATGKHIYQIGFEALQRAFSPEWINRIDEIIAFRPLSSASMARIFDRMVEEANQQYLLHGIRIDVTPSAKEHILRRGYNPRFGARPLRSRLLKDVDAPLADLLASGGIPEGSQVVVAYTGDQGLGEELSFFYQRNHELETTGRQLREDLIQARREPVSKEETKSPSAPQGPSMARSIEGTSRK